MATLTNNEVCRTYMPEARAKRIAKQLNHARHKGYRFKAVKVDPVVTFEWVIEVYEDENLVGWVVL